VATQFWQAAQEVLLVTTGEAESIMESYAAVKIVASAGPCAPIRTLVNQAPSDAVAESVQTRIAQACARFLELTTLAAPGIPREPQIVLAGRQGKLLALHAPDSPGAEALEVLADTITNSLKDQVAIKQAA
jgi:MinD-like ATPase involved in chromosome partitioning or flagellar assembly